MARGERNPFGDNGPVYIINPGGDWPSVPDPNAVPLTDEQINSVFEQWDQYYPLAVEGLARTPLEEE